MVYVDGPTNNMSFNITKTKDLWICFLVTGISETKRIKLSGTKIGKVTTFKLLGVWLQTGISILIKHIEGKPKGFIT